MKTKHSVALQPKLTNTPIGFPWSAEHKSHPPPPKKSTVYLNLIPVKSDLNRSENAEVAFTGNSWRTLVLCLSPLFSQGLKILLFRPEVVIYHTLYATICWDVRTHYRGLGEPCHGLVGEAEDKLLHLSGPAPSSPIKARTDRYTDSYWTPSKLRGFIVHLSTHFKNINLNTFGERGAKILQ